MSAVYKKLEEVCEILDSRRVPITAKDRKAGIYPYYGANGLQDYVAEYIFDDELVLLAEDGGNFGSKERPIAYRVSGKCWVNNHAHVLKAKPIVNVDYLCYALMFYDTEGLVNGATRQKLTQSAMWQMVIPYRDMAEQVRIVDEVSRVTRLIDKRKEELLLLDQLVKSRFIELFGGEKYAKKPIRELVDRKIASARKTYGSDETIHYIDISSIDNKGNVVTGTTEYIMADAPSRAQQCIKYGDILISTVRPNLRNIARNTYNGDGYVASSGFCVLRAKNCDARFLLCAVLADSFTNAMTEVTTGANYPAIKDSDVLEYRVPVPPMELQEQFAAFVEQTDKSKLAVQKGLQELEILKKSLMQQYFG